MKYELERREGIACNQENCYYWDRTYEQCCQKENSVGDPGPAFCIDYRPNEPSEGRLRRIMFANKKRSTTHG